MSDKEDKVKEDEFNISLGDIAVDIKEETKQEAKSDLKKENCDHPALNHKDELITIIVEGENMDIDAATGEQFVDWATDAFNIPKDKLDPKFYNTPNKRIQLIDKMDEVLTRRLADQLRNQEHDDWVYH